jgi:hypothetical protein
MIWRSAFLISCTALAYAMLHGWPDSLGSVMRGCFAVLAWVAGLAVWTRRKARKNEATANARRSPRWPDYLAIGMAILALESGFLWLLGAAPRPLESAGLAIERQFRPEAAALRAVNSSEADARPGNWLWTRETQRPLPQRTDFKPGTKPEVFVRLMDPADAAALLKGRVYVRSFALSSYAAATWSPLPGRPLTITADGAGFVQLAPSTARRAIHHEVFHPADPGGQNALTALQGVTEARISPLERIDDGLFLLPPAAAVGGYQYEASSAPMKIEDLPDGGLVRGWPGAADELMALPDGGDFAMRLRNLARTAAGSGTVKQQLLNLQNHLRSTLEYSLATTNPRNLDPIENFLFEEKRGHCEYFATAAGLMVRSLGLPARVAYGWAGGTWYDSAGLFVFRANEAHAWTEVWLENHGWVIMDPTPQSTDSAETAQIAPPGEVLPGAAATEHLEDESLAATETTLPRLGIWMMLGFGIPAGLIALLRGWKLQDGTDPKNPGSSTSAATPGYIKLWRNACAARGLPMPPGFTLRRQISRLPEPPEFAAELLDYHYGTRYEGRPVDARVEKHLARRIRTWEAGFSGINPEAEPHKSIQ